ncbi:MAG: helix-turn-helix domain-containing protein [Pseudomonadota bacterium]
MSGRRDTPDTADVEPMKGFDDFELRLGDIMRGERATMGKSLLDVQRDLKIKATYIAAIENADPSAFESPGFVAGYVRSYARYLGLDAEWVYKTFCEEGNFVHATDLTGQTKKSSRSKAKGKGRGKAAPAPQKGIRDPFKHPSVSFIPATESRFQGIEAGAIGSVAVLVALIGVIGYGGWSVLQEIQKVQFTPVEQTPGVLSQLDPVVAAATVDETGDDAPDVASLATPSPEAFDRLYRPQALDVPVLISRDSPIATIEPGSIGAFAPDPDDPRERARTPLRNAGPSGPALGPDEAIQLAGNDAPTVQVVEEGPPEIALFAVRPSWVRVRAADGTVVFEKILDAGERFVLPQTEEAHTLRAGNAGSVYFDVGGQTYGPAGEGASVVKNVVMSAEALPETYTIADAEADADLARFTAVAEAQSDEQP